MKLKKIMAIVLAVLMTVTVITGCSDMDKIKDAVENSGLTDTEETDTDTDPSTYHDFDSAAKYFEDDTVVLDVNGQVMTWSEYFNWLRYALYSYESSGGKITDWSAEDESLGGTYEQYILDYVDYLIYQYKSIELFAPEYGGEVTEANLQQMETDWQSGVTNYGGTEDDFLKYIDGVFGSREFYEYLTKTNYLYNNAFSSHYGENGTELGDEEVLDYVAEDGYMMAKHILFLTMDMSTNEPLSDEEQAAALEKAQNTLAEINAYDGDDIEGYFDELMNQYSEDTGLASNPDGYLFQTGNMVEEFENAVVELDEYEISDIVETSYGYHIIMRLPINVDCVPSAYASYGYTLRYVAAQGMFSSTMDQWMSETTINKTDELKEMKLAEIFGE